MTKVLISGGAGFIGSHLTERCLQQGNEVIVVDNLLTGDINNLSACMDHANFTFVEASINDNDAIGPLLKGVEHIYHLAARISVPESIKQPNEYFTTNSIGTSNIVQHADSHTLKSIVLASTSAIYGEQPAPTKSEDLSPQPQSPYAISKLDGEYLLQIAAKTKGYRTASLRYFNVFGPRQSPFSAYAAAIPIFIHKALNHEDLIIYGDGTQTRDFIYVDDIVNANLAASQYGSGTINAAYGYSISINELAHLIIELSGSPSKIIYQDKRPGDVKHSCADISKLKEQLKLNLSPDLRPGLEKTIEYYATTPGIVCD